MSCAHSSKPDAGPCSSCLGAKPRIVTQTGQAILVDGKLVRLISQPARSPYTALPRRKGRK